MLKRPWGTGKQQTEDDPGLLLQGHYLQRQRHDHPPLLSSPQVTPGALYPVLVPTIQKINGQTRGSSKKGHEDDQRDKELDLCRKTEEVESFLSGEEKVQGDLIAVFQYIKGGFKEDGGSLFTRNQIEKTR